MRRWLLAAIVLLPGKLGRRSPPERAAREPNRGAENAVLGLLGLATIAAAGFGVTYFASADNQFLGLALGLALLFVAAACGVAAKRVVPQELAVELRPQLEHPEEQEEAVETVAAGGEGVSRRRLFLLAAGGAVGTLGAATALPALSCGPEANRVLSRSPWQRGRLLVDANNDPVRADGIVVGELVTAFPESADKDEIASPVVVVRVRPDELELPPGRRDWAPDGLLAYSKICTHAGCAVSEYRYPLFDPTSPGPALVCPCHFSTFSVTNGGNRIFGPAGRPLPQLPLAVGADGNLVAAGGLSGRPGPSWWGVRQ